METNKTIVLLQDDKAYWFALDEQHLVDMHVQHLMNPQAIVSTLPAWISSSECAAGVDVELVLDTTLDEVDSAVVEHGKYQWVKRYRQWVLLRQLRNDNKNTKSYPIEMENGNLIGGLMHFIFPESWLELLAGLQESGITFNKISTATEILAQYSQVFDSQVLLVLQGDAFERHVLTRSGQVVFLRYVHGMASGSTQSMEYPDISQTIDLLKGYIPSGCDTLRVVSFPDVQPRCTNPQMSRSGDTPIALGLACSPEPFDQLITDAAYCLMNLAAGLQMQVRNTQWSINDARPIAQSLMQCTEKGETDEKDRPFSVLRFLSPHRSKSNISGASSKKDILFHPVYRVMPVFSISVARLLHRRRIKWVSRITPACLIISAVVLLFAIYNHVATAQFETKQRIARQKIQATLIQSRDKASALHASPAAASESLLQLSRFPAVGSMPAAELLEAIATVVTLAPGIVLDSLLWAEVRKDEDYESLTYMLDALPAREPIDNFQNQFVFQAEIVGQVSADSLQKKMHKLDNFTDMLRNLSGASSVVVLQSPADLALSSDAGLSAVARFAIMFQMEMVQ